MFLALGIFTTEGEKNNNTKFIKRRNAVRRLQSADGTGSEVKF